MRLQNPFAALSTTGLDSQILVVLARTEQYLTVPQICELLPEAGSVEGVRKATARLVTQGTVLERMTGRTSAYALNRDHLLAAPMLQISNAKRELTQRISQRVAEWSIQPLTMKLFGSAARNDMLDSSDIDLFIVMPDEADHDEIVELTDDLAAHMTVWTGNDTRPLLYRSGEIRQSSIFDSIMAEGIDVSGDPTWLSRRLREQTS